MIDIILIVLCSLILVVGIVLIVLLILNKQKKVEVKTDESLQKEIWSLGEQIKRLSEDTKTNIQTTVNSEMVKVMNSNIDLNNTNNNKLNEFQTSITNSINNRFEAMDKAMFDKLNEMNKKVDEKLSEGFKGTSETIAQVRERLQAIDDAQKNIESLGHEVVSLKQVLEGNQTRGQYGEYQLSMVLHSVFGDTINCYEEQYTIKKGRDGNDVRADAVVFMPEPNKMICIDSKFPFKDYQKLFDNDISDEEKASYLKDFSNAVKKHITDIKNKYIVEGKTAPQAIMFIPNDGVFAYIHHNLEEVVEYARDVRVVITSPSTLPSILYTISMVRIEVERAKNLREISKNLDKLSKDFDLFSKEWDKLSNQLESIDKSREKLDKRVDRITNKFDAIKGSDISQLDNNSSLEELPYSSGDDE